MANADIQLTLRGGEPEGEFIRYEPGATVMGTAQIIPDGDIRCNHVYIALQWHTEGRGDRDQKRAAQADVFQGLLAANQFATYSFSLALPREPWSYAGHYVTIIWEVVVQLDVPLGFDIKRQQPIIVAPRRGL